MHIFWPHLTIHEIWEISMYMPKKEKKLIFSTLVSFLIRYSKSHIFASKILTIHEIDMTFSFDIQSKFQSLIVNLCMFNYMQNQDQSKGLKLNFFQAHYILCGKLTLRKILLGKAWLLWIWTSGRMNFRQ